MGSKESKFLNEAVKDIEKDRPIDAADMKKVFDSFDTNKSGSLEGKEVEKFLGFLFDYVFAKNNPAEVTYAYGKH
jgi:Ca2+-binding EF-hand superfamily protein